MKSTTIKSALCLLILCCLSFQNCWAKVDYVQNTNINVNSSDNMSVLIYQDGRALVNANNFLDLNPGKNTLRFMTLPKSVIPESILLSCPDLNEKIEIGQKKYVHGINTDKYTLLMRFKNSIPLL